jgi:hypothetical protein
MKDVLEVLNFLVGVLLEEYYLFPLHMHNKPHHQILLVLQGC